MKKRDVFTVILLSGILLVGALPVLTYPLGRDQGEFATIGRGILDGRVPYTGLWNPKPPAIFLVYGAAIQLFGYTAWGIRVIDFICFPLMAGALYWVGKHLTNRRVAVMGVVGFGAFYFTESFWTLTQNDGIALLPMLLTVVGLLKTSHHTTRYPLRWAFFAGLGAACVLWFKYPFVLFVAALILSHLLTRVNRRETKMLVKEGVAFAAGGLLIGLGGMAYLANLGALDEMIESARLTSEYTRQGYDFAETFDAVVWKAGVEERWRRWDVLVYALILWLPLWVLGREKSEKLTEGWHSIWLWEIAGVGIVLGQAKGYDYHWLPLLPPLILIAADTVDRAGRGISLVGNYITARMRIGDTPKAGALWRAALQILVIVGLLGMMLDVIWRPALPYLNGQQSRQVYYSQFRGGEFVADESQEVVDYLKARASGGDTLFIWGFRPEIYFLTDLRPATRFIFQFPLVADWYPEEWRQENVERLWQVLPPYVLILQVDYMPWVTGSNDDSHVLLQSYTELNNWLIYNYQRETQIGNFFIWRRKEVPGWTT